MGSGTLASDAPDARIESVVARLELGYRYIGNALKQEKEREVGGGMVVLVFATGKSIGL